MLLALAAYLPQSVLASTGGAYAITLHGVQLVWYIALGVIAFVVQLFMGDAASSLRSLVVDAKRAAEQGSE